MHYSTIIFQHPGYLLKFEDYCIEELSGSSINMIGQPCVSVLISSSSIVLWCKFGGILFF